MLFRHLDLTHDPLHELDYRYRVETICIKIS